MGFDRRYLNMTEPVTIGRNEPCPCGSGKKYKRCCGVNAAPKLVAPKNPPAMPGGAPYSQEELGDALGGMDPQVMMQFSQALQRLPKGQMQRLQAIMQKAMNGKDVTQEAQEFEKTLPVDFQNMIQSFSAMGGAMGGGMFGGGGPALPEASLPDLSLPEAPLPAMTEEEARALVAKAAAEGKISASQAENLLASSDTHEEAPALDVSEPQAGESVEPGLQSGEAQQKEAPSKLGRFWRNF